jgi:hypothetical protein
MQHLDTATVINRMDIPFYQALTDSAGLKIDFVQQNYLPVDGPGGPGEVKLLPGAKGIIRFTAKCEQLPELSLVNSKLDLLQVSTYNYLIKVIRFCVVVDGVEIFGSASALRDLGLFKEGNEIKVITGEYDGTAFVRMAPVVKPNGRDPVPYHRFFARRLVDLPKVYDIMKTKGEVKEITFLPDSFTELLHEDAFQHQPESQG